MRGDLVMHTEGLLENNSIYIAGKVTEECVFSHEVYGEGFYLFKVSSGRLSDNEDILPITISERLIKKEKLTLGTKVEVTGQLRSYNNYGSKKNKLVWDLF